jgi:hypothetical protein
MVAAAMLLALLAGCSSGTTYGSARAISDKIGCAGLRSLGPRSITYAEASACRLRGDTLVLTTFDSGDPQESWLRADRLVYHSKHIKCCMYDVVGRRWMVKSLSRPAADGLAKTLGGKVVQL